MLKELPENALDALDWEWGQFEPYYQELAKAEINQENIDDWMAGWGLLSKLVQEVNYRLEVATTLDTNDEGVGKKYFHYLEEIHPHYKMAEQELKEKLLGSGLMPKNFEVPMSKIKAETALFREENLPLLAEEKKKNTTYDKIQGAQTVEWEGEETTLPQLLPLLEEQDREKREKVWRLYMNRWLEDRDTINTLWGEYMDLRRKIAKNAGYENYRDYRWQELLRLDYEPQDCLRFHEAIEKTVVPAVGRIMQRRQMKLGVDTLRPWDVDVDPNNHDPLRPFENEQVLEETCAKIFNKLDPALGGYFETMRKENLLDLANRKGKAPGAYCVTYPYSKRPFVFENAVGMNTDVQTLLHESGHAFHAFESIHWPYAHQLEYGNEIAEVASMSMELLAAPYLTKDQGGFYTPAEAARARIEHLVTNLWFWPYMAVVDAFQHWVYDNHAAATDPANCDAKWGELWDRFMVGVDWTGLEDQKNTGWHRKLHIHQIPFYYVDYGLAQLGATQVWANSLNDQAEAVEQYRYALSLGGTKTLPELFAAAGGKLAFDADTLGVAVDLIERKIEELEEIAER